MKNLREITHLIPAPGFVAVYVNDDGTEFADRLVGWTVAGKAKVVGLVLDGPVGQGAGVQRADSWTNFDRYEVRHG